MFLNRPVIYMTSEQGRQPVIGFVIADKNSSSARYTVHDYVTNTVQEVHECFLMFYTEQRFNALFGMPRELIMSLFWTPHREVVMESFTPWSEDLVRCNLTNNGFYEKYDKYLADKA